MSSMTGVMISAIRRSIEVLAISSDMSLSVVSIGHKKTGARPVKISGGALGVEAKSPLLKLI
jgi:hypothetical protein